jgi:RNA polymerase sigma-70 factor (ECF subfamily)
MERLALPQSSTEIDAPPDADFAALYDQFFTRVYNYVRYRVPDTTTADDVTAQVFERILVNLERYDPARASVGAWVFAIARSTVATHYRAQKRRRAPLSFERLRHHAADTPSPEHAAITRDTHTRLLDAVAELGERERELIALRFGAALNNREIAAMTHLSESNVGVILHRALRKLKARLSVEDDLPDYTPS